MTSSCDRTHSMDLSVMSYEGPRGQQTPANTLFRNRGFTMDDQQVEDVTLVSKVLD